MKLSVKSLNSNISSVNMEGEIIGYASVFNFVDSHKDKIQQGAFRDSISNHKNGDKIKLLWQHDQTQPIGHITEIYEDNYGLAIKAKLLINDLEKAKEAYSLIKIGAINSLSIGFEPLDYNYDPVNNIRIITNLNLWEISFVTFPANKRAMITDVKSKINYDLRKKIERAINILKIGNKGN